MRTPFRGSGPRSSALSVGRGAVLLSALVLLTASGCAKRFSLVPKELEKVEEEKNLKSLSVYTSKRLVTTWIEGEVEQSFEVSGEIRQASARQQLKNAVPKSVPGQILKIEELNGMPLLWVTFDSSCAEPDCAFGFVQTEDKLYRLFQAPELDGYGKPKNHHACLSKRRVMKLGKMKSLGEANDIMVNKKRNGKLRTIHLEVIKEVDNRVRTRSRRSGGVKPE